MVHLYQKDKLVKRLKGYNALHLIAITVLTSFFLNLNVSANDEVRDGWIKIDSITTKSSKYEVEKCIAFEGTFLDPHPTDEYTIIWDFGDGKMETGTFTTATDMYANPGRCSPYKNQCYCTVKVTNTYSKPGNYNVSFSVKTGQGATYTDSEEIVVSLVSPR